MLTHRFRLGLRLRIGIWLDVDGHFARLLGGHFLCRFLDHRFWLRCGHGFFHRFLHDFARRFRVGVASRIFRRSQIGEVHRDELLPGRRVLNGECRQKETQHEHPNKQQTAQSSGLPLVALLQRDARSLAALATRHTPP